MKFYKLILTATFLIGLFPVKRLYSQTFIIPGIGASLHNLELEEFSGSIIQSYEGLNNNFDFDFEVDFKHYLTSMWFVSLNSCLYLRNHEYTIFTYGIIPQFDYSYRLFHYGISSGIEVVNNIKIGIGLTRIFLFNRKKFYSDIFIEKLDSKSLYFSAFFLSYKWERFIAKVSYSKSLPTSNMYGIELFSIHIGYQWKVFEPLQRKSKVNCPKL